MLESNAARHSLYIGSRAQLVELLYIFRPSVEIKWQQRRVRRTRSRQAPGRWPEAGVTPCVSSWHCMLRYLSLVNYAC